ncbi:amino acid transporter [Aulographum hederae CBS 113979]|uniref:Amino acid transporter n=1 Tax=Aulographum hederae CBS 113979 TaxID=1176131 RepID=A0A6G1GM05_9PEZI|nr:amino acid transporter [Aulographum hederae CBS 113979]
MEEIKAHHPGVVEPKSSSEAAAVEYDGEYGDTHWDLKDMQRLGKKQEFKRNFSFYSTLGFVSIYMATWEFVLVSLSVGFANGGFAGLFWTFIGTVLCYSTIVASLAELESMAPTSGGQYHWVSEFAPEKHQKILSYLAGWMSTLGWLASNASAGFIVTTMIEAGIEITNAEFVFPNWQYTLIVLAFIVLTIFINTWGAKTLPTLEVISLVAHILGFFVFLGILWGMTPRNSAHAVFAEFTDESGWNNIGTACLISQVSVLYCNLGSDSIVHISEEVEDASLIVPRAMWWSYVINVLMGIVMLITMLFGIGPLEDVLEADAPYLNLFLNTGSTGVAVFLIIILFLLIFSGNITALATTSREVWAFSRDNGLPGSSWISKMNHKWNTPFNSVYVTSVFTAILCCINFGSTLAFNIIISLSLLALLSTYMISIGCVLHKRLTHQALPPARWSLGRLGLPVNLFAFFYSGFAIVFCCFPTGRPVELDSANWAPLVWVGVLMLAGVSYIFHGKKYYTPPVMYVEGRKAAGVGLQAVS